MVVLLLLLLLVAVLRGRRRRGRRTAGVLAELLQEAAGAGVGAYRALAAHDRAVVVFLLGRDGTSRGGRVGVAVAVEDAQEIPAARDRFRDVDLRPEPVPYPALLVLEGEEREQVPERLPVPAVVEDELGDFPPLPQTGPDPADGRLVCERTLHEAAATTTAPR